MKDPFYYYAAAAGIAIFLASFVAAWMMTR
jgi:hypothetical protein